MKYAIDKFEASEDLINALNETNIIKRMAKALFKGKPGVNCWLKMTEDGELYLYVAKLSTHWDFFEWNSEILVLDCGWDLEYHLKDDPYYYEDQETGQWGIEGWDDPFEYLWLRCGLSDALERVLVEAFEQAKMNRIIDQL